jgi:hypothetical protein
MPQNTIPLTPGVVLGYPEAQEEWPRNPEDLAVSDIDTGVLINELSNIKLLPGKVKVLEQNPEILETKAYAKPPPIEEGTYRGTQLALTKVYNLIEQRYLYRTISLPPRWLTSSTASVPSWM